MGKIAFVFPGQGAQYAGMGKDFCEQFRECREVFLLAEQVTGLPVRELCFEENERLNITEYTQIAMLTCEAAMLEAVKQTGLKPDVTAGLSLGEYGALLASEVLPMEDAFRIVRKRGLYMQEAVPEGGAMAAVLGMEAEAIDEILHGTDGTVSVANYNCPGQTVITGETEAVNRACAFLKEAGAKRTVLLKVSGPFHSPLLQEAGERLWPVLTASVIHDIRIPYVSNVTADYVRDPSQVCTLLRHQVSSSVKWQQSVERMIADGTDIFVEIGPGKTLSGFMRKIDRSVRTISVEKTEDLEKIRKLVSEE